MGTISKNAREQIKAGGLTVAEYVRHAGWPDGKWHGDRCGCFDDRCIGYHHEAHDDCGCLSVLIREAYDVHLVKLPQGLVRDALIGWQLQLAEAERDNQRALEACTTEEQRQNLGHRREEIRLRGERIRLDQLQDAYFAALA